MKAKAFLGFITGILITTSVSAVPTLQVYIGGAAANNIGSGNTWFVSNNSFALIVVGAYGPQITNIDYGTLVASVPQGRIAVNGAPLLTTSGINGSGNPDDSAEMDALTNISGIDGYSTKSFTTQTTATEQDKKFTGELLAYNREHLDAYAYVTDSLGQKMLVSKWEINPGSHDATLLQGGTVVVPAPGALLLGSIGAAVVGWLRKSRMLS